ncbi:hypothetical protein H2248_004172 [Termitomyces sp. 'cryptogamus']|nr:hypothetical protein H2248_004172 [Termitomyces sp. 'cryptogamus']
MDSVYVFDNKAHYTSASATNSSGISFVINTSASTTRDMLPTGMTTIEGPSRKQASINWQAGTFDIDGQVISIDDIRSKDTRPGITSLVIQPIVVAHKI